MAETEQLKRDIVLDMFHNAPTLPNSKIALYSGASESYVRKLLGGERKRYGLQTSQRVLQKAKELNTINWSRFRESRIDFVHNFLPQKTYLTERKTDLVSYFLPTDDAYTTSGSGEDFSGSFAQFEWLSERRIGIGPKITRMVAEDAVREGFKFLSKKTKEVVERPDITEWMDNTKFLESLSRVIYFERVFGLGFLVMYFGKDDAGDGKLGDPYKKAEGAPKAFEAIPPTVAAPVDYWNSKKIDKDPSKWTIQGGFFNPQQIHYSRLKVFMSRPVINRWYGLSIWEPIWDSSIAYYQALVFLLRGFAKWGNTIVKYTIDSEEDITELYDKYGEIIDEMKMNGTIIGKIGSDIGFEPTALAAGLREMMEIWIEDMAAGTGIPVPIMMGRIVSSGLSGVGYLVAERYYWNMVKKVQNSFTDEVREIITLAGFDIKELDIDWNLSITKTDQQRLVDEGLEIENELMKEKLIQENINTEVLYAQFKSGMLTQPPQAEGEGGQKQKQPQQSNKNPGNGGAKKLETAKSDFTNYYTLKTDTLLENIRKRRGEMIRQMNLPMEVIS